MKRPATNQPATIAVHSARNTNKSRARDRLTRTINSSVMKKSHTAPSNRLGPRLNGPDGSANPARTYGTVTGAARLVGDTKFQGAHAA